MEDHGMALFSVLHGRDGTNWHSAFPTAMKSSRRGAACCAVMGEAGIPALGYNFKTHGQLPDGL